MALTAMMSLLEYYPFREGGVAGCQSLAFARPRHMAKFASSLDPLCRPLSRPCSMRKKARVSAAGLKPSAVGSVPGGKALPLQPHCHAILDWMNFSDRQRVV